ncbi:hypothetical protein [Aerosakkonema funiforme]|uniref:hypothetical protein n=1 Tax=Aerosakkonema funiforme TaxID=1246630 RepID=UPI0035B9F0D2
MSNQHKKNLFTKTIATTGIISTGIFMAFPGLAIELNNTGSINQCASQSENCLPVKAGTFVCVNNSDSRCGNPPGNLRNGTLKPGSFACLNNSNPACANPPGNFLGRTLKPGSFACMNNSNSVCGNPRNYEVCP